MIHGARTSATVDITSHREVSIFRTALRLIGQGFAEIAQGIRLIAEGTLRPVRSLVPSFVALVAIAALTITTLVLVVTTVAQADPQRPADNSAWTRWSSSPEIRFGDNTVRRADLDHLAATNAWTQEPSETTYVALWLADQ
jgi:hypothetical protein